MKKETIKNVILGVGVLALLFSVGINIRAAGYLYDSKDVKYDNSRSGLTSTYVDGAIDELYEKTSQMDTYKDQVCPGCVYRKSADIKYNVNSTSSSKTDANSKLTSTEYTTDYTTLNSNYFLGHVIDSNGYILASYVCGINNGTFFCFRGTDSNQSSLTYKPFYQENVNRMNKAFPSCNATTSSSSATCSGDFSAKVSSSGAIYVNYDSSDCYVYGSGQSTCA